MNGTLIAFADVLRNVRAVPDLFPGGRGLAGPLSCYRVSVFTFIVRFSASFSEKGCSRRSRVSGFFPPWKMAVPRKVRPLPFFRPSDR